MMLHGSPSPKPTVTWSPTQTISMLNKGKLTKKVKEEKMSLKTVRILAKFGAPKSDLRVMNSLHI